MFDAGVDGQLDEALGSLRSFLSEVDVDGLQAHEAARVVELCAEAERMLAALRVSAAATLRDKALWRREGFRSLPAWLAAAVAAGPAGGMPAGGSGGRRR